MRRIDGLRADGSDALEDVLAAYRLYAALSDAEKAQVVNYSRLDGIWRESAQRITKTGNRPFSRGACPGIFR